MMWKVKNETNYRVFGRHSEFLNCSDRSAPEASTVKDTESITNKLAEMFSSGRVDSKKLQDGLEETLTVRKELQETMYRYITDTQTYINTVGEFCENHSKWLLWRETELEMMNKINVRAEKGTKRASLEEDLTDTLKNTIDGLTKLDSFLDALEKLAVTSPHVFTENQALDLHMGTSLENVQNIISYVQHLCPLLLEFKRDAQKFFKPKVQNVKVLSHDLKQHIQTIKQICTILKISSLCDLNLGTMTTTVVKISLDIPEDEIRRMTDHIRQLDDIRKNVLFRMVFLFRGESCEHFIKEFTVHQPQINQHIHALEEVAVQLDSMSKGAKISSVAGSSVGAVGGVLSIVGLALIPFTAGLSLGLTMAGVGLGVTSGVNSIVTTATEIGVNTTQLNKIREIFQNLMEDVQCIEDCLHKVTSQVFSTFQENMVEVAIGVTNVLGAAGVGICVADVPEIGQAIARGTVALTTSARVGFIALNSLFLGMDIFFICKDSISLAKGTETEASQFIRARIALWRTKVEAWQEIREVLNKGLLKSDKNKLLLDTPLWME